MTIKELENELQFEVGEYGDYKWGKEFTVEFEIEGREYSFVFCYSFKKRRFECYISIYNAANDNNAENVEGNTLEEIEFDSDLESLVNYVSDMYALELKDRFNKELEKGQLQ